MRPDGGASRRSAARFASRACSRCCCELRIAQGWALVPPQQSTAASTPFSSLSCTSGRGRSRRHPGRGRSPARFRRVEARCSSCRTRRRAVHLPRRAPSAAGGICTSAAGGAPVAPRRGCSGWRFVRRRVHHVRRLERCAMHESPRVNLTSGVAVVLAPRSCSRSACWAVVPAPTFATLPLAVAVPEWAPRVLAFAVVLAVLRRGCSRAGARESSRWCSMLARRRVRRPGRPSRRRSRGGPPNARSTTRTSRRRGRARSPRSTSCATFPCACATARRSRSIFTGPRGAAARRAPRRRLPLVVAIYGGAWSFGSRAGLAPLGAAVRAARLCRRGDRLPARAALSLSRAARRRRRRVARDRGARPGVARRPAPRRALRPQRGRGACADRRGAGAAAAGSPPSSPTTRRSISSAGGTIRRWPIPLGVRGILDNYLGGPPDARRAPARIARRRRSMGAHLGMPPVLLIWGDRDQLVLYRVFSASFAARLRALRRTGRRARAAVVEPCVRPGRRAGVVDRERRDAPLSP